MSRIDRLSAFLLALLVSTIVGCAEEESTTDTGPGDLDSGAEDTWAQCAINADTCPSECKSFYGLRFRPDVPCVGRFTPGEPADSEQVLLACNPPDTSSAAADICVCDSIGICAYTTSQDPLDGARWLPCDSEDHELAAELYRDGSGCPATD